MPPPASRTIYVAGGAQIDPAKAAVRRDGVEHFLRAKTLHVLCYLIEHRDRMVTREELLREVWGGVSVSDDVVTQCISDLRKVLGDDARAPRFLKTIPKVGLRFIHEIQEVPGTGALELEPVAASLVATEIETTDSVELEVREEIVAQRIPRRGWFRWAVAALAITGAGAAWWTSQRTRLDPGVAAMGGKTPVAVMFFEDRTGGADRPAHPESDWLREGLADMLITELARSPKLAVLAREQLRALLQRTGRDANQRIDLAAALELARRGRAQVAILGAYTMLGPALRVDVQIYDAEHGRLVGAESLTVDQSTDLLAKFGALSTRIALDLKAPLGRSGDSAVVSEARTANLEAFRSYSLGVERAENFHSSEALELFHKAAALDPNFAMAHARIGYTYALSAGWSAEAKPYLEKAFSLSARLTSRDRLFITAWYSLANEDYEGAIRAYRQILEQYPAEVGAYVALGRLLRGEQRYAEARDVLLRALTIDPDGADLHNVLSGVYFELGDTDRSIGSARRFVELAPAEPNAYDSLGLMLHRAGRYAEAIAQYERALQLNPNFDLTVIHLGNTLTQLGRDRDAAVQFRRFDSMTGLVKSRGREAIAWALWRKRDFAGALRELKGLPEGTLGPLLKAAIDADRGVTPAQITPAARARHMNARGARLSLRTGLYLEAYVELRRGNSAAAIQRMREALAESAPYWSHDDCEEGLADVYLELGRNEEAVAEYKRVLTQNPNRARARYHLGLAYERLGNLAAARDEWKRFAEIWKDADPELPEVLEVKKRLGKSL